MKTRVSKRAASRTRLMLAVGLSAFAAAGYVASAAPDDPPPSTTPGSTSESTSGSTSGTGAPVGSVPETEENGGLAGDGTVVLANVGAFAEIGSPSLSADGQWAVFTATLADGRRTVARANMNTGDTIDLAPIPESATIGDTIDPAISADGCVVAANTEVPFDLFRDDDRADRWDVYRLTVPECGGNPGAWELVSVGEGGTASENVIPGDRPAVSGSGALIAYVHQDARVPEPLATISVVDLTRTVGDPQRAVIVAGTPVEVPNRSFVYSGAREPAISEDGRHLAFSADFTASDLLPGWSRGPEPGGPATRQVYVWDLVRDDAAIDEPTSDDAASDDAAIDETGDATPSLSGETGSVHLVSSPDGETIDVAVDASRPDLSDDGRVIVFQSATSSLVPTVMPPCQSQCPTQVYRFDRDVDGNGVFDDSFIGSGNPTAATPPVSTPASTPEASSSTAPEASSSTAPEASTSTAPASSAPASDNPAATSPETDPAGPATSTDDGTPPTGTAGRARSALQLVSAVDAGHSVNGDPVAGNGASWAPSVSADGDEVGFVTDATNLMPTTRGGGGTITDGDLLIANAQLGRLRRPLSGIAFAQVPGAHDSPQLSSTGQAIAFSTAATAAFGDQTGRGAANGRSIVVVSSQPELSMANLDFGAVRPGLPSDELYASLRNAGPAGFAPTEVVASPSAFAVTGGTCSKGIIVAAGESCSVYVTFTPTGGGIMTGTLTVKGRGGQSVVAELRGGAGEPTMRIDPGGVDLGEATVGQSAEPHSVHVVNVALGPSRVNEISIVGDNADDFTIIENACKRKMLSTDATCELQIGFTPTGAGYRNASLVVVNERKSYTAGVLSGFGRYQPSIGTDTELVRVGEEFVVSGSGFPADAKVSFSIGSAAPFASASAGSDGTFTATLTLPERLRNGRQTLIAASDGDLGADVTIRVANPMLNSQGLPGHGGA